MNDKTKDEEKLHSSTADVSHARYARNLGTIGADGQKKLFTTKVIIAGLGGLGGYVADVLVRLGVGKVIGIDYDSFEESNLNRQLFADQFSVGKSKAHIAKEKLATINNQVEFIPLEEKVETIGDNIYAGSHIIFDCLDNASSRIFLQNKAKQHNIPLIHGAIGGWYGQVAVIWPGSDLLSRIYETFSEGVESKLGTPSFIPPVAAGIMVAEGVKILLGENHKESFFIFFDLLNVEFQRLNL